jgi:hypothetical protein
MLLFWLKSEAFGLYRAGRKSDIDERRALAYWRLTSGSSAAKTHRCMATSESAIHLIKGNIELGLETPIYHSILISLKDAQVLLDINQYLQEQFKEALKYLESQRK